MSYQYKIKRYIPDQQLRVIMGSQNNAQVMLNNKYYYLKHIDIKKKIVAIKNCKIKTNNVNSNYS